MMIGEEKESEDYRINADRSRIPICLSIQGRRKKAVLQINRIEEAAVLKSRLGSGMMRIHVIGLDPTSFGNDKLSKMVDGTADGGTLYE